MPYNDIEKQKQCQHQWYLDNKELTRKRSAETKRKQQEWYQNLKSSLKCIKCGENHIACLDFHHKDRNTKEYEVAFMASRGCSKKRF